MTEQTFTEADKLQAALLLCARQADALKLPCGDDPESPQAIRNGQYAAISQTAHVALGTLMGPSAIATLQADNAKLRAEVEGLRKVVHDACSYMKGDRDGAAYMLLRSASEKIDAALTSTGGDHE